MLKALAFGGLMFVGGYATCNYVHLQDMFSNSKRIEKILSSVDSDRSNERYLDRMVQDAIQKKISLNEQSAYTLVRDALGPKGLQSLVGNQGSIDYMKRKQEFRDAFKSAYDKAMKSLDDELNLFEKDQTGKGD